MKRRTRFFSLFIAMAMLILALPLSAPAAATDKVFTNLATQAQTKDASGNINISTLGSDKTKYKKLAYGSTVYYPLRTSSNGYLTDINDITPGDYTCTYEKSADESFNAVSSVSLVFDKNTASVSRWWLKVDFIGEPASPPAEHALNGTFRINSADPVTDVAMAPKDYSYPLALVPAPPAERIVTTTSTAPQYIASGSTLIAQNGTTGATSSRIPNTVEAIYYLLRDGSGDIISPAVINPADYIVTHTSPQFDTAQLVKGLYSAGERWYIRLPLKAELNNQPEPLMVTGSFTITHIPTGTSVSLDMGARNIELHSPNEAPFNRVATWAQRKDESGAVRSISGAGSASPNIKYGETIYYALANGSNTTLTGDTLLTPSDYEIDYLPASGNSWNPFVGISLSYEDYATSTASGKKWFLKLDITSDDQGLMLADGCFTVRNVANGREVAVFDLAAAYPIILGEVAEGTEFPIHRIGTTKMVANENGEVGTGSSLGISTNVDYGQTIYYMLYGRDNLGGSHPITSSDVVKGVKIKNELTDQADKIESIELVKRRSTFNGKPGFYYFLALKVAAKENTQSRYTVRGDITLEKKGKLGIDTPTNSCTIFIDTTIGPEYAHSSSESDKFQLSSTFRRFRFGTNGLAENEEQQFTFYGMSEDSYFTINTVNQDDILLGNNVDVLEDICNLFPDAELFFFNGGQKTFNKYGIMTFAAEPNTYIYEREGTSLSPIKNLTYDEAEGVFRFPSKKIGSYVFSNIPLAYDRYTVNRIATWAQAANPDGSVSTISNASAKSPSVEYGSTVYYALRNSTDKDITNQLALDPKNFTFYFASTDQNANLLKQVVIAYRTNLRKSDNSRTNKYYLGLRFGEVPDPGKMRTLSGELVLCYNNEEVTRLSLTDAFTMTIHGGRPVHDDIIPIDYVKPELILDDSGNTVLQGVVVDESESEETD